MRTGIILVVVEAIVGIVLFPVNQFFASVLIGNAFGNVALIVALN